MINPCPFCGGTKCEPYDESDFGNPESYAVGCLDCNVDGPVASGGTAIENRAKSIELWNQALRARKPWPSREEFEDSLGLKSPPIIWAYNEGALKAYDYLQSFVAPVDRKLLDEVVELLDYELENGCNCGGESDSEESYDPMTCYIHQARDKLKQALGEV